jgi:hypothetical protein
MALVAANVEVATTGAVYVAPIATALPTNATTALAGGYLDVGYIHEDGVTETQDTETEDIKAWQLGATVRKVQTSHDLMYNFTMLETNGVVLKEYYGDFTAGVSAADDVVLIKGTELPNRRWVLSVVDGLKIARIVIPAGQITERGEVTYTNSDAIGREVTITCYPDSSGNKAYIYRNVTS